MKHILLATDLSVSAEGASTCAAWLAKVFGARLTVMSAYRPAPVFAGNMIPESPADNLPELVYCRLEEEAARFRAEHRIMVDVLARSGDPVRAILTAALDIHADLIVIGKIGCGHADNPTGSFFGATVVTLARKTPIAVLIVPQGAACITPKVIAVSKELMANGVPDALREFLVSFGCRLCLLGVKTNAEAELVEIYQADAIHSPRELFHLFYEIPVDRRLPHSMENFIEAAPIHWLAARPLPGLPPDRWVLQGRSKELALDIRVPLLILPELNPSSYAKRNGTH